MPYGLRLPLQVVLCFQRLLQAMQVIILAHDCLSECQQAIAGRLNCEGPQGPAQEDMGLHSKRLEVCASLGSVLVTWLSAEFTLPSTRSFKLEMIHAFTGHREVHASSNSCSSSLAGPTGNRYICHQGIEALRDARLLFQRHLCRPVSQPAHRCSPFVVKQPHGRYCLC